LYIRITSSHAMSYPVFSQSSLANVHLHVKQLQQPKRCFSTHRVIELTWHLDKNPARFALMPFSNLFLSLLCSSVGFCSSSNNELNAFKRTSLIRSCWVSSFAFLGPFSKTLIQSMRLIR